MSDEARKAAAEWLADTNAQVCRLKRVHAANQLQWFHHAELGHCLARIAELEKAFSLLIAVTVNGRIIKGRVGDYYQPQVPVAEIDNARKALKESGE